MLLFLKKQPNPRMPGCPCSSSITLLNLGEKFRILCRNVCYILVLKNKEHLFNSLSKNLAKSSSFPLYNLQDYSPNCGAIYQGRRCRCVLDAIDIKKVPLVVSSSYYNIIKLQQSIFGLRIYYRLLQTVTPS